MVLHGRHFLANAGVTALVLALFPTLAAAEAEPAGDTGTDDVVVLGLTDSEGDPTPLVEEETAAGAQLFRAQTSAVMTSALDVPEFSVAGVTWDGDDAPAGRIELRVRSADGWTEWQELEPEIGEEGEVAGTEPFIVGSGTGVQVRIGDGVGSLPESLELHLIPPNPTDEDVRATDLEELADLGVPVTTPEDDPTHEPVPAPDGIEGPAGEPDVEHTEQPTDTETAAPEQSTETPTQSGETEPGDVETEQPTDAGVPEHETPSAPDDTEWSIDGGAFSGDDGAVVTTAAMTSTAAGIATPAVPEVRSAAAIAPVMPTAAGRPRIISRSAWGADDSRQIWNVRLRAAVIHHTAGTNNYTRSQSAGIVRGIQRYHMGSRGWPDVGYNFLVDKYGQIFEGRRGSTSAPAGQMPEGAHARGYNAGTMGVSVLGNYTSVNAPDAALQAMARIIAWKFDAARIDMSMPSGFTSPGTAARPAGQNLARIFAHRDVDATTCPGNNIYARIPRLNEQVAAMVDGDEYHFRNSLTGGPADLSFRLGLSTDEVLVGDWNGNGRDTLALRRGSTYYVYSSHPGYNHQVIRYGRPDDTVLVGDWNGDGKDTLAVRRGSVYHVKNSMTGGDADRVINYGRARDQVLVGDWNGNGQDTFAVRRGAEYHVKNRIAGGDADRVFRYGRANDDVLVGDWNRDRRDTFAVRRGSQYHVRNSLTGGDAHVVLNYGRPDDVVLIGDWNGDGRDTFGVRRSG